MTARMLRSLRAALAEPRAAHPAPGAVPAAVLVPIFERDGDLHLLYTTRSAALPHHAGEVAFPGGRHAAADASLLATALRETVEEIGVAPEHVDVLGALDPVRTFRSNFLITPYVGHIPYPYELRLDPREVADVFSLPLATLTDPATSADETWTIEGRAVPVSVYRHGGRTIWGATQRITASFVDLVLALRAGTHD